MEEKRKKTVAEIDAKSFRPKKYSSSEAPHRLFHLLPQHGYGTRYMPIDTHILLDLHRIVSRKGHRPEGYENKPRKEMVKSFRDRAQWAYWWRSIFDFKKLKGVEVWNEQQVSRERILNHGHHCLSLGSWSE